MDVLNFILNILSSGLPAALLALGIFITYRLLDFADLTTEGSFLIGAVIAAVMISKGINPWLATITSIVGGACCGIITGVLNRCLKIPKLLSGIITMTAVTSIAMLIMGIATGNTFGSTVDFTNIVKGGDRQTIYTLWAPWKYDTMYESWYLVAPWSGIIKVGIMAAILVVVMIVIYYFFGTEYGMAIRATGMNEDMARAQGINTDLATVVGVAIANALIALAGALYVQETRCVNTMDATGFLVVGLAAILVGEAVFGKRSFKNWLISVALGSIVYYIIVTVAAKLGLPSQLKYLLYAVLITIALCIPLFKQGFANAKQRREQRKAKEAK